MSVANEKSPGATDAPPSRAGIFFKTAATRFFSIGLSAASAVIVARALQPEGRGTLGVVVSIAMTAASLGHLSISQANLYLFQQGRDRTALVGNSLLCGILLGCLALSTAMGLFFFQPQWFPGVNALAVAIALSAVPFNIIALYLNGLLALTDRLGVVSRITLMNSVLQTLALGGLAWTGRLDSLKATALWAVAASLPALLSLRNLAPWRLSRLLLREMIGVGWRYHIGLAGLFLLWRMDVFMLNAMAGARAVGLYVVAVTCAEFLNVLAASLSDTYLPLQVAKETQGAALSARVFRINVPIVGLAALAAGGLSPFVIPVVFGAEFKDSVAPLIALLPGLAALGFIQPVTAFLVRQNRPLRIAALTWGALATNFSLNLLLIPEYHEVGAGLASSLAYGLLAAAFLVWFVRAGGLRPRDLAPGAGEIMDILRRLRQGGHPG